MRKFLGVMFLLLAVLQLGFRGRQRIRNDVPLWDFVSVYSASRTWLHGHNPYDTPRVIETWRQSGLFADRDVSYFATVYPPTSLLMLTPFALLDARTAMIAWLLLTGALLVVQFAALADMARLAWRDSRVLLLVGAALFSAPLQFGILSGQLSMPAISLCIVAFWCATRRRDTLAGILLGLACALKPQIGGPFVAYYLLLRRTNVVTFSVVVGGAIAAAALIAMRISHVDWIAGWTQSVAATTAHGAVNDYGWANRFRDEIVDLKLLLVGFVHGSRMLLVISGGIVLVLGAWYLRLLLPRAADLRQIQTGRDELLILSGLAALSLLPIYHRVYDVALLTTGLAWALAELDGPRRKYAVALLISLAVFLVPFDAIKSAGSRVPGLIAASRTAWFQGLLVPHYAWGLLATTVVVLVAMSARRAQVSVRSDAAPRAEPAAARIGGV